MLGGPRKEIRTKFKTKPNGEAPEGIVRKVK